MKFTVKRAQKNISILEFTNYREYLNEMYVWLKSMNKRYSYQKFAEELGFAPTNFIQLVILDKRSLTESSVDKIIDQLGMKKLKGQYFKALVAFNQEKHPENKALAFANLKRKALASKSKQIPKDQYAYFSNWYNVVIRELLNIKNSKYDVDWIYNKLLLQKIPKTKIQTALKLLEKLGLIERIGDKGVKLKDRIITTGEEIQGVAVKNLYLDLIEFSKEALSKIPAKQREFGAQTICVSQDSFNEIKSRVREFRKDILSIVEKDVDPTNVYQIIIQAFPLTQKVNKRDDEDKNE